MRRAAILIGAGASYGAGLITPAPPPLGRHVFGRLQEFAPITWGAIPKPLNDLFAADFELGMHEVWTNQTLFLQSLLLDMARFFAQFEPPIDGSDRYTSLIKSVVDKDLLGRCAICSLNYECVVERSAGQLGVPVSHNGGPDAMGLGSALIVLKPHGACNLFPPMSLQFINSRVLGTDFYDGPIESIEPREVARLLSTGYTMPPAMSLFAPGKETPVAASFVIRARNDWRAWVGASSIIAVIGARPLWADSHIWDPIVEADADILFVGDVSHSELLMSRARGRVLFQGATFVQGAEKLIQSFCGHLVQRS